MWFSCGRGAIFAHVGHIMLSCANILKFRARGVWKWRLFGPMLASKAEKWWSRRGLENHCFFKLQKLAPRPHENHCAPRPVQPVSPTPPSFLILTELIATTSAKAAFRHLIFEVPRTLLDRPFRFEIAIKIDVMLGPVSDHDFDRFLIDLGPQLGPNLGPKTGSRRVR